MIGEKDSKIVAALMRDGRASVVEISDQIGLPRTTVQQRIRKMVDEGVIRKFTAVPDFSKLGRGVTAYVLVSFSGDDRLSERSVAEGLAAIDEVTEVSLVSGEWDMLLKVRAGSVEEIGSLVIDKLRMMKGVGKTQTCLCFQTVKEEP